jgi:multidrug efflux system membrane fusion protein
MVALFFCWITLMNLFEPEISPRRRLVATLIFVIMAFGALFTTYLTLGQLNHLPRTTDASIEAEVVRISSGLPGRIVKLAVRDNDTVKKGQLLFSLEDTTYRLLRDQAAAQLDVAQAVLADATRLSKATQENASTAKVEIQRAESLLKLAETTVNRLKPLAADGITSQQELDAALTAEANARVSLQEAQNTARSAKYLVKSTTALEAEVRTAKAALALAEHNLSRTQIRAPFDGKITGLTVTEGTWVLPEMPVFTLIDTSSWHVVGFFRETDLSAISPGQSVRIRVQSNPDVVLHGKVRSIGWGVLSTDGLTLKGTLPFVPTSTNWVRLAKRFPVKISLDTTSTEWLRMGASATVALETPPATESKNHTP